MLIVLEGCDGVGKTTVAEQLASEIKDAQIVHCTRETQNDFEFFMDFIERAKTENIILDRGMYGQFVYQEHNERKLTPEQLLELEKQMSAIKARVFYICASRDAIRSRLNARLEVLSLPLETILARYESIFARSIIPIYVWDTTATSEESIWQRYMNVIQ